MTLGELDPVTRAIIATQPRRTGRRTPRHGRLAQPGMAQLNVAVPRALIARLRQRCEDATIRAQGADPLAPPATMSAVIEQLIARYVDTSPAAARYFDHLILFPVSVTSGEPGGVGAARVREAVLHRVADLDARDAWWEAALARPVDTVEEAP